MPNLKDTQQLMNALSAVDPKAVSAALKSEPYLDAVTQEGTPLVHVLLRSFASHNTIDTDRNVSTTALAAILGMLDQAGVNLHAKDESGETIWQALHDTNLFVPYQKVIIEKTLAELGLCSTTTISPPGSSPYDNF
jgi:hypothetical protein